MRFTRTEVALPGQAVFGRGSAALLAEHLDGVRRVLVVSGRASFRPAAPAFARLRAELHHFPYARPNPTIEQVEAGVAAARQAGVDAVVGVGGGSAMDLAKAIAVLAPQPRPPRTCLADAGHLVADRPRLVLLPTTCGTGSELTSFATIYMGQRKHSLDTPLALADVALIDPLLSLGAPPAVAAAAAADAVCQAIESAWAVSATDRSLGYAMAALDSLFPGLARADHDEMARGAALAGAAINLTRTTAAHALSYGLTARLGVPHGMAVALHLRWLVRFNEQATATDCRHPAGPSALAALIGDVQHRCRQVTGAPVETLLDTLLRRGGQAVPRLDPREWTDDWSEALTSLRAGNNPRVLTTDTVRDAVMDWGNP
ncbi:iron-containing alcohol dehydrogenase [Planosporangium sp. 12N6]|uniref:iron-containing alcohol dehydrogenase n=1 Tax=Planosporangium spinosum TaxID=3402278 RepID=UPI003CFA83B7